MGVSIQSWVDAIGALLILHISTQNIPLRSLENKFKFTSNPRKMVLNHFSGMERTKIDDSQIINAKTIMRNNYERKLIQKQATQT